MRPESALPTLHSLQDLKLLKRELAQARLAFEARRELEAAKAHQIEQERRMFELAVGPVTLLPGDLHVLHQRAPTSIEPRQRIADERQALLQTMSDDFDVDSLLETDETLSFRRPQISINVVNKLR